MSASATRSPARAERPGGDTAADRASTGVDGLDEILGGGLTRNRVYLLEGTPGTGKTTFALRFLIDGLAARRARPLHHPVRNRRGARAPSSRSHGWSLDGIDVFELADEARPRSRRRAVDPLPVGGRARRDDPHADGADRARHADARRLRQPVGDAPARAGSAALPAPGAGAQAVLLDPLVHRAAARRQDLGAGRPAAAQHLARRHQPRAGDPASSAPRAGACASSRCAARSSRAACTTSSSTPGGSRCFRAWSRRATARRSCHEQVGTGSAELDQMLGGGLTRGTSTLLLGPSGVGKTTTAVHCMHAALQRGERATYYLFDEGLSTLLLRSRDARHGHRAVRRDRARAGSCQIDPAELSPGEFAVAASSTRSTSDGSSFVAIDSLNAYLQAMPGQTLPAPAHARAADLPQPPRA